MAILLFESEVVDQADPKPSTDVQLRLIRATDTESAYRQATELGNQEEVEYENPYGQTCKSHFKGLEDLDVVLDEHVEDGIEIYGFIEDGAAQRRATANEQLTRISLSFVARIAAGICRLLPRRSSQLLLPTYPIGGFS